MMLVIMAVCVLNSACDFSSVVFKLPTHCGFVQKNSLICFYQLTANCTGGHKHSENECLCPLVEIQGNIWIDFNEF